MSRTTWAVLVALLVLACGLRGARWVEEREGPLAKVPLGDEASYDGGTRTIDVGDSLSYRLRATTANSVCSGLYVEPATSA